MQFWYFLSTRFGRPVCELKESMPYSEFVTHAAYHRLCPWGDDWRQTQALHATMMNCSPKYKTFSLDQYFPQRRKKQSDLGGMFDAFKNIAIEQQSRGNVR